jgi:hypothetical protein
MIEPHRVPRPIPFAVTLLAAASILAACSASGGGGGASAPASDPPTPVSEAPASVAPSAAGDPLDPDVPTACITLDAADCALAQALAMGALTDADPPVRYVQVGPFGCLSDPCARTLAARPEGDVTIEFEGGQGITVHLRFAPDGTAQADRAEAMGVSVPPSSRAGMAAGPQPYTLGHCGVLSGIDADGSWWDPVGPVDWDSPDAINAAEGIFTLTDPTHAIFVSSSGFTLQLVRHEGPKLLPMCM